METKNYSYRDDVMLIKTKVGIRNVIEEVETFATVQPDISIESLNSFETHVNNSMGSLLGLYKNGTLKKATKTVEVLTKTTFEKSRLLKRLIENNFKEEKDDLFDLLAITKFYRETGRLKQESAISMLSAIARNETELKEKFESKSLPVTLIDEMVQLSKDLIEAETAQEQLKGGSKPITEQQRKTLNDIYTRIMDICKLGQVLFANDPVKKDKFVFSKLAGGM